jgi:glycine cleavage system aminomethyltransferase T
VPGLLSRLFGKPSVRALEANLYTGDETLEVVGESHYQDALWRIVGGHRRDPVRYETEAVLELEAGNRHDANAISGLLSTAPSSAISRARTPPPIDRASSD